MKKNLIVLLIVTLLTGGLFADVPENTSFDVTTTVAGIDEMGITKTAMTLANFDITASNLFTTLTIGGTAGSTVNATTGAVSFDAYLSTRSNNRSGYTVKVSATPMVTEAVGQTTPTINYTVSVAGTGAEGSTSASYNTASNTSAIEVIDINSLEETGVQSRKISLTVNMTDYNAAVQGSYTGTVTFVYTSGA